MKNITHDVISTFSMRELFQNIAEMYLVLPTGETNIVSVKNSPGFTYQLVKPIL